MAGTHNVNNSVFLEKAGLFQLNVLSAVVLTPGGRCAGGSRGGGEPAPGAALYGSRSPLEPLF